VSKYSDLKIITVTLILTIIFALLPPLNTTPLRTILGIPMVLFLPGYALIAMLFPKKSDLDGIERIALSFGLSIAVVPLIGLGLNFTPFGIRLVPVLLCISFFTLVMCAMAYLRRSKISESERFDVTFSNIFPSIKESLSSKTRLDKVLNVILILSIIISIIMLLYVIITPKQGEKFTEFYILGDNGKAEGYPKDLESGKNISVIIGIVNHEYVTLNYTLKISLDNDTLSEIYVPLMHNMTWEKKVFFTPEKTGTDLKLGFFLYKENNFTMPYRDLHLWVAVSKTDNYIPTHSRN